MRLLLLPALALVAAPTLAQTDGARTDRHEVIIQREADGPSGHRMVIVNGDTLVYERLGAASGFFERAPGADVAFEFEGDGPARVFRDGDGDGPVGFFRPRGADGVFRFGEPGGMFEFDASSGAFRVGDGLTGAFGEVFEVAGIAGASAETRDRMRQLEREARELAREARSAEGADRREAEARLDAVLGELFEVRGEARREQADRLRQRAAELAERAEAVEAALAEREARRRALIESRRAELLGTPAADW